MNHPAGKAKNKLQIERESRGWSRKYVASQLHISEYTVGQWERGKHRPYPEHIQKLCDLYEKNAGELGLVDVAFPLEQPEEPHEERHFAAERVSFDAPASSQSEQKRAIWISAIGMLLVLVIVLSIFLYNGHSFFPNHTIPGGAWISPIGPTVGDIIHFAAYAYPTHAGEPAIDHVNFTTFWQGVDPRRWIIACVARIPVRKDVFACDANIRRLEAHAGQIKISFDVYDRQGNVSFAPNGEHTITYVPSS